MMITVILKSSFKCKKAITPPKNRRMWFRHLHSPTPAPGAGVQQVQVYALSQERSGLLNHRKKGCLIGLCYSHRVIDGAARNNTLSEKYPCIYHSVWYHETKANCVQAFFEFSDRVLFRAAPLIIAPG